MATPESTIVVVGREAFSSVVDALHRLLVHTPAPRRVVVVDGGSPRRVAARLEALAREHDLTLLRSDAVLGANEARNLALPRVGTRFVVLVDNDTLVGPGWLAALERCADETGAAAVVPAVTWGPTGFDSVHFAGGSCRIERTGAGPVLHDNNPYIGQPVDVLADRVRERTEMTELHCLLVRRSVLAEIGPLDDRLVAGRDEADLALRIARVGATVWFEPAVVVGYPFPKRLAPSDLPSHLTRWSDSWSDRSFRAFHRSWGLGDHATPQGYRVGHRERRIGRWPGADAAHPARARLAWARLAWARLAWRVRRAVDLVVTPACVAWVDRARARARPPRVVHAASWDRDGYGMPG